MGRANWALAAVAAGVAGCIALSSAAAQGSLSADVNGDGCVDDIDLMEIDAWSQEPSVSGHPITFRLDVNGDQQINGADVDEALAQYGQCQ
jgi:Dockerin type I domain